MPDENADSDAATPPASTPASLPEAVSEQIRIALGMGITNAEDISALLNAGSVEDIRANMIDINNSIRTNFERLGEALKEFESVVRATLDAPGELAVAHAAVQKSILARLNDLAPDASAEELAALSLAYSNLPGLFSQAFHWPTAIDGE